MLQAQENYIAKYSNVFSCGLCFGDNFLLMCVLLRAEP